MIKLLDWERALDNVDGSEDLLLELARLTRVDRQMSRIVGTRRQLDDGEATLARQKQLDAEHADIVERLEHGTSHGGGLFGERGGDRGRHG